MDFIELYIPENCTCSGATFQFSTFRIALENVKYFLRFSLNLRVRMVHNKNNYTNLNKPQENYQSTAIFVPFMFQREHSHITSNL